MEREDNTLLITESKQGCGDKEQLSRDERQQIRRQGTKQKKAREFPAGVGRTRQVEAGCEMRQPYDSPLPE